MSTNIFLQQLDQQKQEASPSQDNIFLKQIHDQPFSIKKEPSSIHKENRRHTLRSISRIAETVGGLPGDIRQTGEEWIGKKTGQVAGGRDIKENKIASTLKKIIFPQLTQLPTSKKLREFTKETSKGYLEPQTEGEQFSDDIIQDITSSAIPVRGKIPFIRAIGASTFANLGKKALKELGFSEKTQDLFKLGTFTLGAMINPSSVQKYKDSLYHQANTLLPKDAVTSSKNLKNSLDAFEKNLKKGGTVPSKAKALTKIEEIKDKIQGGKIKVDELSEFKKDINEIKTSLYGEYKGDKAGLARAKANLENVSSIVDSGLSEYGKTNPEWEKIYRQANQAHGGIIQSKKFSNFIGRKLKEYPVHSAGGGLLLHTLLAGKAIPAIGLAYGGVKGAEVLARIFSNETLFKYYSNLIKAGFQENSAVLLKNFKAIDEKLAKEESVR